MRKLDIDFEYYYSILKRLRHYVFPFVSKYMPGQVFIVTDDQGLLSTAYVGNINFFDPYECGQILTQYNFRPYLFEVNREQIENVNNFTIKNTSAKIIHLLGNKPYTPDEKRKDLLNISRECLELWDKYENKARRIMEGL